jgi:hypothetical protein
MNCPVNLNKFVGLNQICYEQLAYYRVNFAFSFCCYEIECLLCTLYTVGVTMTNVLLYCNLMAVTIPITKEKIQKPYTMGKNVVYM